MKVFQLTAHGSTQILGEAGDCCSKKLFPSRSAAIAYEPEFRIKCTTLRNDLDFGCLEDNDILTFRAVELEISFWDCLRALVKI
jgi:hypothetical protein